MILPHIAAKMLAGIASTTLALVLFLTAWAAAGCGKTEPKVATPPPAVTASTATAPAVTPTRPDVTDDDVRRAIERGREWLLQQQKDGLWPERPNPISPEPCGTSELAAYTLVVCGTPMSSPQMTSVIDALLERPPEKTYAASMQLLALTRIVPLMEFSPKRDKVRLALVRDLQWLVVGQGEDGGWGAVSLDNGAGPMDFGHTHMALVAIGASADQCCIPAITWVRAMKYLSDSQQPDGSWPVSEPKPDAPATAGYGPTSAAGIDGLSIIADNLALWPAAPGAKAIGASDVLRRIDIATVWFQKNFATEREADVVLAMQTRPGAGVSPRTYWLYAAGRAATQIGYPYLGNHDWYAEGAANLVARQQADGSWGDVPSTCLAMLFLQEGDKPVLFNKLAPSPRGGSWKWNNHPRDLAGATHHMEKETREVNGLPGRWQIVSMALPMEDLHAAPILYISAATVPHFTHEETKKFREFTDTGGTIFIEAADGNEAVRNWFASFVCDTWPEFHFGELQADHPVFNVPNRLKDRPALGGVDDGSRTIIFYAPDDISKAWQQTNISSHWTKLSLARNLVTYAAGDRPLHGRLWRPAATVAAEGAGVLKAGPKKALFLSRLEYDDRGWIVGRNYKGFEIVQGAIKEKAGITLALNENGIRPAKLDGADVAFMTGTTGTILPDRWVSPDEREALRQYLARGGFLWAEATAGSKEFGEKFLTFAAIMNWKVEPLPPDHPIMTGRFATAVGRDLGKDVSFRRALRIERMTKPSADLAGIYQDGRLVGIWSPLDIVFSTTDYPAYGCRGYAQEDARAVAANILLYLSDREAK
jgi:hypothetical protein